MQKCLSREDFCEFRAILRQFNATVDPIPIKDVILRAKRLFNNDEKFFVLKVGKSRKLLSSQFTDRFGI